MKHCTPMQYAVNHLPALLELQHAVLNAVVGDSNGAEALLRPGAVDARRRLDVYAHTVRVNFRASLESTYPVIHRLVGADYFRQLVSRFQQRHPSRNGDLAAAGADFAPYLKGCLSAEFAYLAEVARLEWLVHEAALAVDAAAFDVQRLATVPVSGYDALQFSLNPSARLFSSPYPCVAIWQANVDLEREPSLIDLNGAPCTVAIVRNRKRLEFHALADGEVRLLHAFANALSFAAAVEQASTDSGFEPSAALQRFVRSGIVVDFT